MIEEFEKCADRGCVICKVALADLRRERWVRRIAAVVIGAVFLALAILVGA